MPSATDLQGRCSILSPELALPSGSHATTTRSHGALHILGNPVHQTIWHHRRYVSCICCDLLSCGFLLGCLDTLAAMQELKMGVASAEEETQAVMKVYSKEDYSVVNRFES